MSETPSRSWWARRRWTLLAAVLAAYLFLVSPLCVAVRIYFDVRSGHRLPDAARLPLSLAGLPAGLVLEAAWPDGGLALRGWVGDLAEEHNRRDPPPVP